MRWSSEYSAAKRAAAAVASPPSAESMREEIGESTPFP
jgi:hypothetical protein